MNHLIEQEIVGRPVTVKLRDGREFPLAFPMGVVILIKQLTGKNLFQSDGLQEMTPAADPENFIKCLWAAMHTYDAGQKKLVAPLPLEELSTLVDFGNLGKMAEAINSALTAYLPKPEAVSPNAETV